MRLIRNALACVLVFLLALPVGAGFTAPGLWLAISWADLMRFAV